MLDACIGRQTREKKLISRRSIPPSWLSELAPSFVLLQRMFGAPAVSPGVRTYGTLRWARMPYAIKAGPRATRHPLKTSSHHHRAADPSVCCGCGLPWMYRSMENSETVSCDHPASAPVCEEQRRVCSTWGCWLMACVQRGDLRALGCAHDPTAARHSKKRSACCAMPHPSVVGLSSLRNAANADEVI